MNAEESDKQFSLSAGDVKVIDFGCDGVGGYAVFNVSAYSGSPKVRLSYATHPDGLGEKGDFWRETRATYLGEDVDLPILPANVDRFDIFEITRTGEFRAPLQQGLLRYARIAVENDDSKDTVTISDFRFENLGTHSDEAVIGSFKCSDEVLNKIWAASVRTCQMAAIPARTEPLDVEANGKKITLGPSYAYLSDGAKRDRLVWSGDLWFADLNMYYAFGPDSPYMPGSIHMLAENQTPEGYVQACPYPESHGPLKTGEYGPFQSDEFAAWLVPVVYEYWLYTGDTKLVADIMPVLRKLVAYLESHCREDGLFEQRMETSKNAGALRFGDKSTHHRSYMNVLLLGCYRSMAKLVGAIGEEPRAQSPEPRAQSPEPRAQSPEPRAQSPRAPELASESLDLQAVVGNNAECEMRNAELPSSDAATDPRNEYPSALRLSPSALRLSPSALDDPSALRPPPSALDDPSALRLSPSALDDPSAFRPPPSTLDNGRAACPHAAAVPENNSAHYAKAADKLQSRIIADFGLEGGGLAMSLENPVFCPEATALWYALPECAPDKYPVSKYSCIWHAKFQSLLIRALFESGYADEAIKAIYEHNWPKIVAPDWLGTSTTYECMHLATKGWGDEAHPDTAIAGLLSRYILGIAPVAPGYRKFVFRPPCTTSLSSAGGVVPTSFGPISASWTHADGIWNVEVSVPAGINGILEVVGHPPVDISSESKFSFQDKIS